MAARAFEQAWRTGTFICQSCREEVRVAKGARIPECPNGHRTYSLRIDEPAGESPSAGHPKHGGAASPRSTRAAMHGPGRAQRSASTVFGTLGDSRATTGRRISREEAKARIERHKPGKAT
jgi:hypothetical protein